MSHTVLDLADGEYMLPAGKIAMVVTWLEQTAPPQHPAVAVPEGVTLRRWSDVTADSYLTLFRAIGAPWLWFGRLIKSPEDMAALLSDPQHLVYVVERGGEAIGLLELAIQDHGDVEVSYFGFVPEVTGAGLGRWLMTEAQTLAWAMPETKRLWVHTCSADSPAALPFYQKLGFVPYARGIEIADDPRLKGIHDRDAGPAALPLIG
jgi:ribosomal protein S18 acetylase RimI-like enzyme